MSEPLPAPALRVLVVDDDADTTESLCVLIRLWGHEARAAGDGPGALVVAAEFLPHVALLDLGLPGMDGFEVGRRLRSLPALEAVILVALTGYGDDESRRRSTEEGFALHLVKPSDAAELEAVLGQLAGAKGR
jgi:CheY-like chemotaxis protein